MFATLPHPTHHLPLQNSFHYAPARPSPLAPRNANVPSRAMMMSGPPSLSPKAGLFSGQGQFSENYHQVAFNINNKNDVKASQEQTQTQPDLTNPTKPSTYAQRYTSQLSNPVTNVVSRANTSSSPSARAKRRDMFLNRVKRDRDAGKFDARGEQLMMMEHVAEQKQWGETMRRDADGVLREYALEVEVEVEEQEGGGEEPRDEADVYGLNELISQEQEMEQALLEDMRQDQSPRSERGSFYGDDDYDDIFMDLVDHIDDAGQIQQSQDMDMSG